ncbi:uncharacterized protein PAC_01275 [Phialocephala subalpina]|uniref:WW domain-containing protein n=1 Tax=Phialocephala subalpina TaxID=576137 RepID=A0A1L7WF35_9HELO|nr:uncharacterized protein PAC_01275 [Phialocephala subalpina]
MEVYKYQPLSPERNEIRLLKLIPAPPRGEVVIEVFHADATSNPEYEALSYVWGAPDLTHEVCIRTSRNDILSLNQRLEKLSFRETRSKLRVLPITRNLAKALSYLTLPDRPRILWIDAICINQTDEVEKSREVAKMGEIYGQASRVVVWLGEGQEDSSLAITTLKAIGESIEYSDDGSWEIKPGSEAYYLESELSNPRTARGKVLIWMAIRNFFQAPWFTRLWVFQEVGRASDTIFMVGAEQVRRHILLGAFEWVIYSSKRSASLSRGIPILDEKIIEIARPVFDHSRRRKTLGHTPFRDLVNWTKRMRCYDPRDRIYALLSLLHQDEATKIVPNYSSTTEQVYTNAILNNIESNKDLRILEICDFAKTNSKLVLPSWVPDLSVPNPLEPMTPWCPAGISAAEYRYGEANGVFRVRGRNVCVINYVATPVPISASIAEALAICYAWEPLNASDKGYITGGNLMDAFIATLFLACCPGYLPIFTEHQELLSVAAIKAAYLSLVAEGVITTNHQEYVEALQTFLPGRSFFTTKEGYIGLCPASACPGDKICIAFGSFNPLILRSVPGREGHYQVGGACFVYGLMNGEGILGPSPPGWTHRWMKVLHSVRTVFLDPNHKPTQFDPRAGPLPAGWKVRYYETQWHRSEIDHEGNLRRQTFWNEETGERTWADPRLTSENLRRMGIKLQDIILV